MFFIILMYNNVFVTLLLLIYLKENTFFFSLSMFWYEFYKLKPSNTVKDSLYVELTSSKMCAWLTGVWNKLSYKNT